MKKRFVVIATDTKAVLYINDYHSCYKYVKSKQIRTQGKFCSQEVQSSLSHNKMLFLLKNYHCEIWNRFRCLNWRKKGEFAPEFQMLSKFSLVFISTTASSKVVNHASIVNVFSCKNSQFELTKTLFHGLIGEALLFLWKIIFLMKAKYQEGIFAVEKWQN